MNKLKRWASNTSTKTVETASSVDSDNAEEDDAFNPDSSVGSSSSRTRRGISGGLHPQQAVEPSPSAGSPDKLRLSLLQASTTITPGSTIQGHVDLPTLKDCKNLHVILTGKCACTIMGKMRFQAAIGVNSLGGAGYGYGGAAPLTLRESHSFLNIDQTVWDGEDGSAAGAEAEKPSSTFKAPDINSRKRFEFDIDVPRMKQCTCPAVTYSIPPSIDLRRFDPSVGAMDASTIEVKYSISAVLDRKGLLKRKQK